MPVPTSAKQRLVRLWTRGLIMIATVLAVPLLYPKFVRAVDSQAPGRERAQVAERQARAGGERHVTASGDTVRAVVYTPASPSEASTRTLHRGLTWWSRLLAFVMVIGLLRTTRRINAASS